jgi:hypothetical protein
MAVESIPPSNCEVPPVTHNALLFVPTEGAPLIFSVVELVRVAAPAPITGASIANDAKSACVPLADLFIVGSKYVPNAVPFIAGITVCRLIAPNAFVAEVV